MPNIVRFTIADNYSKSGGLAELTHRETVRSAAINSKTYHGLSLLIDNLRQQVGSSITSVKKTNGVVELDTSKTLILDPLVSEVSLVDQVSSAIRAGENKKFNLLLPTNVMKLIPPSRRDLLAIEVSEYLAQLREAIIREAFPDAEEIIERSALYETDPDGTMNFIETKETFKSASKKGLI